MTSYRALGIRPVVNAAATLTRLGGSRLAAPAVEAMACGASEFVDLLELRDRIGDRIAELTGNAAAFVTSGASAGITLSVAGCLADDLEAFPADGTVVMARAQRNHYDYAARQLGARIAEFSDTASLGAVLDGAACVLWFAGAHYPEGPVPLAEIVAAAHERNVQVLVDAAAQVPPIASLWRFTVELGVDAAIFSGGKGLRGPQATGLVLGTAAIVAGCRRHASPEHAVGRGMKVGKEELLGLLAAVEWSLGQDEAALIQSYEDTVERWVKALATVPGVRAERGYPSEAGQPHGRALLWLDESTGWTHESLVDALWDRDPRIAVGSAGDAIALNPQTLDPGEDRLVLDAILSLLGRAWGGKHPGSAPNQDGSSTPRTTGP
ncbi:aminotransferase class V-fold PLP-dependent enzyme [Amycolatopsis minnesotensis]|uniref:Aminotransferase class V-fold PLP-dependent enzyme n=1 Tax=Amycolatopsis minnesotensis TaxID=337894 RepID=A0ABN2RKP7_9PSEU